MALQLPQYLISHYSPVLKYLSNFNILLFIFLLVTVLFSLLFSCFYSEQKSLKCKNLISDVIVLLFKTPIFVMTPWKVSREWSKLHLEIWIKRSKIFPHKPHLPLPQFLLFLHYANFLKIFKMSSSRKFGVCRFIEVSWS